jgi:hypothetical protein
VHAVAERGRAVLGHVLVAAQYMLLAAVCAGRAGAGPRGTELAARLVLICEEGLEAPINIIVQNTVLMPMCSQKRA